MKVDVDIRRLSAKPMEGMGKPLPRDQLAKNVAATAAAGNVAGALDLLVTYAGASHYLLARDDLLEETGLKFIVTSDWPFDLVRRLGVELANSQNRSSEMEKCLSLLQPRLLLLPEDVSVPYGIDRQYSALSFCVGRIRLSLLLLFPRKRFRRRNACVKSRF